MLKNRAGRGGFTLPEVLVTVAIVAVLAAAVVPAVTQQISKGDQGELTATLAGLKTGVTSYVADVRRFPATLDQIINGVSSGDTTYAPEGNLNATEAARWRGPYLQTSFVAQDSVPLGFGLFGMDTLRVEGDFLLLRINGTKSEPVFTEIDELLDNGDGNAAGALRWTATTPGTLDSIATYRLSVAK